MTDMILLPYDAIGEPLLQRQVSAPTGLDILEKGCVLTTPSVSQPKAQWPVSVLIHFSRALIRYDINSYGGERQGLFLIFQKRAFREPSFFFTYTLSRRSRRYSDRVL